MKFGNVEGLCVQLPEPDENGRPIVRVTVYLETDMGLDIVREVEVEAAVNAEGKPDLYWEADQWTQETIARVLIPRGWELLAATDPPARVEGEVPRSPRYALRTQFWVPPPGFGEEE